MSKSLYIAEKPSVAKEFAKAIKTNFSNRNGYMESENAIVTWCVGHLVTMSYPEAYGTEFKKWSLQTLPFIPEDFKYEIIPSVSKQFYIVKELLNRADVDTIYVCTDSGREGEYIYRLVEQMAEVKGKNRKRVWIDSQTEEEILRGIETAKDLSAYDNLGAAAYLRAKEDYLMGINFSRLLTLKFGDEITVFLKNKRTVIAVGRVMTCVLGMVVRREREIRSFVKTKFYRVNSELSIDGAVLEGEWKAVEGSVYYQSPKIYKDNGFYERKEAEDFITYLKDGKETIEKGKTEGLNAGISQGNDVPEESDNKENETSQANGDKNNEILQANGDKNNETLQANINTNENNDTVMAEITSVEKKKELKNAPLLFNLAELQNECSKLFKINPDETLKITQELYEKKLVTYPRTDARVLSSAVAKVIDKNIKGLMSYPIASAFAKEVLEQGSYKELKKTRYVNDKQITDHYAIIPTGQGLGALKSLSETAVKVYEVITRRFLSIFYPAAVYQKLSISFLIRKEAFFVNSRVLKEEGYLKIMKYSFFKSYNSNGNEKNKSPESGDRNENADNNEGSDDSSIGENSKISFEILNKIKKNQFYPVNMFSIKEGETSPPKRYNSGSIILAMENAGQLIEDEELRAQIKGNGIGTSATRAEILKKLITIEYIMLNKKTQIITPSLLGEMIYDVVDNSIRQLLNPELTASWEKGLNYVAEGSITDEEYIEKLRGFVERRTNGVKQMYINTQLKKCFDEVAVNYKNR